MNKEEDKGKPVPFRSVPSVQEETELERLKADMARGKATTDYLAMMTGVDLSNEESEVQIDEQEV